MGSQGAGDQTYTIVTGGNRGLGYEACRLLLQGGHSAILCSRSLESGTKAAAELQKLARNGAQIKALQCDTSDLKSIDQLAAEIEKSYKGQIVGLVNNAAIFPHAWTQSDFDQGVAINFTGPLHVVSKLAPLMKEGGTIVQVASELGALAGLTPEYAKQVTDANDLKALDGITFDPNSGMAKEGSGIYNLTKAMMIRSVELIAPSQELTSRHLTINAICPGWCRTDMGGKDVAPRSPEQGGQSMVDTLEQCWGSSPYTGQFYRDGKPFGDFRTLPKFVPG